MTIKKLTKFKKALIGVVYGQEISIEPPSNGSKRVAIFDDLNALVQFVINLVFGIGLSLALLFVIIGGIKYIMSKGDESKATEARNTITNAIIGAVVIIAFKVILDLVLKIVGADTTNFGDFFSGGSTGATSSGTPGTGNGTGPTFQP